MAYEEIKFRYQVGNAEEMGELEARLKPLLDNYTLSGSGRVLVYPDSARNRLIISPKHLPSGHGKIKGVELKENGQGGLLYGAKPEAVEFYIKDGDSIHEYRIEYEATDFNTSQRDGFITGDNVGAGSISSNINESMVTLVLASLDSIILRAKSGYEYSIVFGCKNQ